MKNINKVFAIHCVFLFSAITAQTLVYFVPYTQAFLLPILYRVTDVCFALTVPTGLILLMETIKKVKNK